MTLFGKRVFADVIKDLEKRSSWIIQEALYQMTSILIRNRREDTDTGKRPCDHGNRDWSDAAISQGMPGATRSWKRQGRILP